jgi:hypothetical protein
MNVRRWFPRIVGLALLAGSACGLFGEEELTDGEVCTANDDCETGVCTSASLCSHSRCECPSGNCPTSGETSPDCRDGWVCVRYDSLFDPLKEFFGGTPNPSDGYCQPSCDAGCPEHYLCEGELCTPDAAWAAPEPTIAWSGAASGELTGRDQMMTVIVEEGSTITLTGSAVSPMDATIVSLTWTTVSGAGDYMSFEDATIETTVPLGAGSYRRVEFDAVDDRARSSRVTVIFEACSGASCM